MKKIMSILVLLIFVTSCKKKSPIPSIYVGTWVAETEQLLSTQNRIHTLEIRDNGKGSYKSSGQTKLLNRNEKGRIKIENNMLKIGNIEFEIKSEPQKENTPYFQMQLNNLHFEKK